MHMVGHSINAMKMAILILAVSPDVCIKEFLILLCNDRFTRFRAYYDVI